MIATWLAAGAAYVLLVCLLTWPLPLHLQTHLLGDTSGDLGVYIWNIWIFRHELLEHSRLPFSTDHVFAYTAGADFSLHNYTPLAGMLGVPLVGSIGLVATFNVILLAFIASSGLGTFALARRLGLGPAVAWAAGAIFVASPVLTAREATHFSLAGAAPLPLFLCALLRTLDSRRIRDAVLTGAMVALATYSDAYYGIYCAIMGAFVVVWRFTRWEWRGPARSLWLSRGLEGALAAIVAFMIWRALSRATAIDIGPVHVGLRTLYTPVLLLVVLGAFRAWLAWRPGLLLHDPGSHLKPLVRLGGVAFVSSLVLLLPLLVGIAMRFTDDQLPETEVLWRSSPRGVDALSYLVPNPNHPWFGARTRSWLMPDSPDAFPEFVGSFSLVALAVIALGAAWRVLPPLWAAFTAFFLLLSLGPFVHVGGVNTYAIGPWALLRYIPVIDMARSPSRFTIVATLGLSLLFGFAVRELCRRSAGLSWVAGGALTVVLALELLPFPRPVYSANVPDVYRLITALPGGETGRVLELPTGIRDGVSSLGDFSASSQYFQTTHKRPLIGGYLSRVSRSRKGEHRRTPMLRAIFALSEGRELTPDWRTAAQESRDAFLRRSCVRFVVLDKRRASDDLRTFAVDTLRLTQVHEDAAYELYIPIDPPDCDRRRRRDRGRFRDTIRWLETSQ